MKYTLLLLILLTGCHSYKSLKLKVKNPTEYVFNLNTKVIKNKLINVFSRNGDSRYNCYKGMDLIIYKKDTIFNGIPDTIKRKFPKNSIFLYNDGARKLTSSMYYKKNRKLRYYASFLIILDSLDKQKTKVKIKTIFPEVVVGNTLLPTLPHFVRMEKTKRVKPSTVEEYELLMHIGKILKVDSMPPIHYPVGYEKLKEPKEEF